MDIKNYYLWIFFQFVKRLGISNCI